MTAGMSTSPNSKVVFDALSVFDAALTVVADLVPFLDHASEPGASPFVSAGAAPPAWFPFFGHHFPSSFSTGTSQAGSTSRAWASRISRWALGRLLPISYCLIVFTGMPVRLFSSGRVHLFASRARLSRPPKMDVLPVLELIS